MVHACILLVHACILLVHACILLVHACILLLLYYFQQPSFKVQYNSKWFVLLGNRKYREQLPNCLKKK